MTNFTSILTIVNFIVALAVMIGGYFIVRYGIGKLASEIQDRVRQGLLDENKLLRDQLVRMEDKVNHLESMLETAAELLQQKGFKLTVGDDTVTLEGEGKVSSIRRKPRPQKTPLRAVQKKETS